MKPENNDRLYSLIKDIETVQSDLCYALDHCEDLPDRTTFYMNSALTSLESARIIANELLYPIQKGSNETTTTTTATL
jgi:hypothetical protein